MEIDGERCSAVLSAKELIERHIGELLTVKVSRRSMFGDDEVIEVSFRPKAWTGLGVTGFSLKSEPIF